MPRLAALAAIFLLAGCGPAPQEGGGVTANQIERLSRPEEIVTDPKASVRLQPLTVADVRGAAESGAACRFTRNGILYLLASDDGAAARVAGALNHYVASGPVGPSGGYFENRQISISAGRTSQLGAPNPNGTGWPGRVAVTNRRNGVQAELRGTWTCRV
jgi:hypothetical protein